MSPGESGLRGSSGSGAVERAVLLVLPASWVVIGAPPLREWWSAAGHDAVPRRAAS